MSGEKTGLFGPTIREILDLTKIGFDTHFGTINCVYFDEHDTPRDSSPDRTPDFLHALQTWFTFYTKRNKTSTIKIETAKGTGFVIAIVPITQHKTQKDWFQFYMEKNAWKNSKGEYWKNGVKFVANDDKVTLHNVKDNDVPVTIKAPKDELQVNVMLEMFT